MTSTYTSTTSLSATTVVRAEYERVLEPFTALPVARALPWPQRLWQQGWLRKALILVVLACLWEIIARVQDNDLLLPGFLATARAFAEGIGNCKAMPAALCWPSC